MTANDVCPILRWLGLGFFGSVGVYVLYNIFMIFVWGPLTGWRHGRAYMWHNWEYVLREHGLPNLFFVVCVSFMLYVIWNWKGPYE